MSFRVIHSIRLEKLNEIIVTKNHPNTIFEGHIAHFLKNIDKIIVLRCHPNELKNRLSSRNYSDEKIAENMEAEALNIITDEAIELYGKSEVLNDMPPFLQVER